MPTLVGTGVSYTVAPQPAAFTKIWSVIEGALTTGDATLTAKIGAPAITGGVLHHHPGGLGRRRRRRGDADRRQRGGRGRRAVGHRRRHQRHGVPRPRDLRDLDLTFRGGVPPRSLHRRPSPPLHVTRMVLMLINAASLNALRAGFSASFMRGLGQAPSQYPQVATVVPASAKEQKYGWLGKFPRVREWVGPRMVHALEQHDYAIREKKWELTIEVDRDDIETDNLGIYGPMFEEMGASTQALPDELVWALLRPGSPPSATTASISSTPTTRLLDGRGAVVSVRQHTDGGSGTPWFLLTTNRPLKPIILQRRRDFQFVAKDKPDDDNVFDNNAYKYGADARMNVGYGFWQQAWGSKQTLNAANYATARAAITGMKGDYGRPLGLMPNLLVVPPALEGAARALLQSQLVNGGETNPGPAPPSSSWCPGWRDRGRTPARMRDPRAATPPAASRGTPSGRAAAAPPSEDHQRRSPTMASRSKSTPSIDTNRTGDPRRRCPPSTTPARRRPRRPAFRRRPIRSPSAACWRRRRKRRCPRSCRRHRPASAAAAARISRA